MPKMIAVKKQQYAYKNISVGDIFTVRESDVRLLTALGRVKPMVAVQAMTTENTSGLVPNAPRRGREESKTQVVEERTAVVEPVETAIPTVTETPTPTPMPTSTTVDDNAEVKQEEEMSVDETTKDPENTTIYGKMLRDRARGLGIRVDYRWNDERVQREIDEYNKRTYQHADMRSE